MSFYEAVGILVVGILFYYYYPQIKHYAVALWEPLYNDVQGFFVSVYSDKVPLPQKPAQKLLETQLEAKWFYGRHLLVYGGTGSGKSTLVDVILTDVLRSPTSQIILINPHHKAGQWGTNSVVGRGRNFEEIELFIPKLLSLMDERYERYTNEQGVVFSDLFIIVDEVPAIKSNIDTKVFASFIKQIGSEARKVKMWLILLTQSKYTKQLGLEGASDMLENFIIVSVAQPNYKYTLIDQEGNSVTVNNVFSPVGDVSISDAKILKIGDKTQ